MSRCAVLATLASVRYMAQENVFNRGSIHHKTSSKRGPYGYPDPGYFINCNEELDALGVPSHDDSSLQIVFATRCATSVNFGFLYEDEL